MALGSNQPKKLTRQEMIDRAQELDLKRQEQINNQVKIINRLLEINQMYEAELQRIADLGLDCQAGTWAAQALDKAAEINKKHREGNE